MALSCGGTRGAWAWRAHIGFFTERIARRRGDERAVAVCVAARALTAVRGGRRRMATPPSGQRKNGAYRAAAAPLREDAPAARSACAAARLPALRHCLPACLLRISARLRAPCKGPVRRAGRHCGWADLVCGPHSAFCAFTESSPLLCSPRI